MCLLHSCQANSQLSLLLYPQRRVAFLPFGPISLKSLKVVCNAEDPKALGDHLRRRRNESGLHQRQAADRMAVSEWTYANWENGRTTPGAVVYRGIVEFLGPTTRTQHRGLSATVSAKFAVVTG